MTQSVRLGVSLLAALGLLACGVAFTEAIPHNVCRLPAVREVLVSPVLVDEGWLDAILWAFDEWKRVVPGLSFRVTISDQSAEVTRPCATSFVPFTFLPPEYPTPVAADTRNGFIRVGRPLSNAEGWKRACMLHELGHLLFGFGHTKDMSSIMFPVIQAEPHLSDGDIMRALLAFSGTRDGAT